MRPRFYAICAYLAAVGAVGFGVWWIALGAALGQLGEQGRADLSLASDRLVSQLQSYRELAVLLADHPSLVPLVTGGSADVQAAQQMLLRTADMTGSLEILLLNGAGAVVAQSHGFERADGPRNLGETSFFKRSQQGGLGSLHAQFGAKGQRSFTFAAPVFGMNRKVAGAVAVSVDLEGVETDWRASPRVVFFTDASGVVFVTNRAELLYQTREPLEALSETTALSGAYRIENLRSFFPFRSEIRGGEELWVQNDVPYLPERALHVTQPLPLMNMQGEILVDSSDAEQLALLQALVAGAIGLFVGAVIFFFIERRRVVLDRLALEAETNLRLEARVKERTRALEQAQQELVQAGKLSALGQMSAGISHELNQPLMAIRSYAENAEEFLKRGKSEIAGDNLGRISDLAHRMGRIIKNLRAFARHETEPLGRVELGTVLEAVLDLLAVRLRDEGVQLHVDAPDAPVFVLGGEVRLQQVLMNLLGNAMDAMEGRNDRALFVSVAAGDPTKVLVRDTGPGLAEVEKIFDPFYTTKEVGRAEGMGLGLSISYGIVQSFGGIIKGRNHPEGGAEFTIELPIAPVQEKAA
ncbi:MAG: ATP-binding protein [Pseudomonadota bacterium]